MPKENVDLFVDSAKSLKGFPDDFRAERTYQQQKSGFQTDDASADFVTEKTELIRVSQCYQGTLITGGQERCIAFSQFCKKYRLALVDLINRYLCLQVRVRGWSIYHCWKFFAASEGLVPESLIITTKSPAPLELFGQSGKSADI